MYLVMFHKNWKSFLRNIAVTSLAEVWIETGYPGIHQRLSVSLPLRKCGLKHTKHCELEFELSSLPLRKCGLKHLPVINIGIRLRVTSLAEVWIETKM